MVSDSDTDWDSDLDEIPASTYTQRRQASAAKARESMTERTPLLGGSPPPPAYADATRNDANGSQSRDTNQHGGNSQVEPILFNQDRPQRMSNHPVDPENGKNSKPRRRYTSLKSLICLGLILLTSIVIISVMGAKHANSGDQGSDDDNGDNKGGGEEKAPSPPYDTIPGIPHRSSCHLHDFTESQWFDFNSPRSFSLVEVSNRPTHISGGIGGQVLLRSAPAEQTAAIVVGVRYATSGVEMSQLIVKAEPESLLLKVPHLTASGSYSCVDIDVTIFVRPDVALEDFELATETLNIKVDGDVFEHSAGTDNDNQDTMYISNSTSLYTVSGDLSVCYWSSRETRVEVISGSVTGRFALRDLLFIKTQSGSIDITVDPKPVDKDNPKPAQFIALSTSGSIRTYFPISGTAIEIPDRDYHSKVETKSGSIEGDYILGSGAYFRTISGSIKVEVLPYAADLASSFTTETQNGQINAHLLPTFKDPGTAIRKLRSLHKSTSASLSLKYPQQWEGTIEGLTVSGSLHLTGKDVRESKRWNGPVGVHVVAEKGHGDGRIDMKSTSGSIHAAIGDELLIDL